MAHPYSSSIYAETFGPEYFPIYLKNAETHVLKRKIPGTDYFDAMGIYPVCPIAENADLEKDFADLKAMGIVSLVLVTDAFRHPLPDSLKKYFDLATPFKEH